ncbi:hypothetical protein GGH94_001631 [Coemansia aciculifera]|uniref:Calcipressin n=2 Tax=Coemansia TaxID=4863 RepID=A0A9W8LCT5_9FUNG|nr:hypothetical protein GGI19_001472 [Coemansia pectinata]KAJ2866266.1 hypothetical protein GGH94_001631 [Coemansia aciculifera]
MAANRSEPKPEATNSLIAVFTVFTDHACDELRTKLEACGHLCHFAKLPSFERCLAIFSHTADAQTAMRSLNLAMLLPNNKLRMFYSRHTSMSQTRSAFLEVPAQEKLWLISPPGSPPINWRQTREDPPNAKHLDYRLEAALQELSMGQFTLNPTDVPDYDSTDSSDENCTASSASQVKPLRTGPCAAPTILIQNYDSLQLSSSSVSTVHCRPPTPNTLSKSYQPTARPPI